jgi:hypothetical protein
MKRSIARTTFVIISAVTLCMGLATAAYAEDDGGCSTVRVAGKWGFTLTGTLLLPAPIGPVPGAAVGRISVDAAGNISGTEARNVGGSFANETITGSWTVNSDCTTIVTVKIYESGVLVRTSVLSGVFVNQSNKLRAVQESLTNPDGSTIPVVITLDGDRLSHENGD